MKNGWLIRENFITSNILGNLRRKCTDWINLDGVEGPCQCPLVLYNKEVAVEVWSFMNERSKVRLLTHSPPSACAINKNYYKSNVQTTVCSRDVW